MPRFFQYETAAHGGEKNKFNNIEFKQNDFENSLGATAGTLLEIIPVHIKNPPVIQFVAYLESLSDGFQPQYTQEQPFGRIDPYYIWKSASRKINLTWSIPSSSKSVGLNNLNNLSWFLAALYPAYKRSELANSIAATPLFRVRYANLISSPTDGGQGILCIIEGVSVTHSIESGFIHISPENRNLDSSLLRDAGFGSNVNEGEILQIPKLMKVTCTLNVIHDHSAGWDAATGEWRGGQLAPNYPYGLGLVRDAKEFPSVGRNASHSTDAQAGSTPNSETPEPLDGSPQHRATASDQIADAWRIK